MRILIVNDDGYKADGINILANKLSLHHSVVLVAPQTCNSGMSHAMTFNRAIYLKKNNNPLFESYAISGTPADCVKIGLSIMGQDRPDLVISGINNQANLGTDVSYSGTASAAMEASLCGYKAIAVSSETKDKNDFEYISDFFIDNLDLYMKLVTEKYCISININIPRIGNKGHKIVHLGERKFCDIYLIKPEDNGLMSYTLIGHPLQIPNGDDTDVQWFNKGYATITPLFSDASAFSRIDELKKILQEHEKI